MKGVSLILALVIFSTSLKASAFVASLTDAVDTSFSMSSCCSKKSDSDTKQCSDTEDSQKDKGCCERSDCDCTCCLHIAFLQHFSNNSATNNDFSEVRFDYSFLYRADYLSSVFHPPAQV